MSVETWLIIICVGAWIPEWVWDKLQPKGGKPSKKDVERVWKAVEKMDNNPLDH